MGSEFLENIIIIGNNGRQFDPVETRSHIFQTNASQTLCTHLHMTHCNQSRKNSRYYVKHVNPSRKRGNVKSKISEILNVQCFVTKPPTFNAHKKTFNQNIVFKLFHFLNLHFQNYYINVICFLHYCSSNKFKNYSYNNVYIIPYFFPSFFLFCLSPLCHG